MARHLFTVGLSALNLKNEFTEGNVAVEGWVNPDSGETRLGCYVVK